MTSSSQKLMQQIFSIYPFYRCTFKRFRAPQPLESGYVAFHLDCFLPLIFLTLDYGLNYIVYELPLKLLCFALVSLGSLVSIGKLCSIFNTLNIFSNFENHKILPAGDTSSHFLCPFFPLFKMSHQRLKVSFYIILSF